SCASPASPTGSHLRRSIPSSSKFSAGKLPMVPISFSSPLTRTQTVPPNDRTHSAARRSRSPGARGLRRPSLGLTSNEAVMTWPLSVNVTVWPSAVNPSLFTSTLYVPGLRRTSTLLPPSPQVTTIFSPFRYTSAFGTFTSTTRRPSLVFHLNTTPASSQAPNANANTAAPAPATTGGRRYQTAGPGLVV